MTTTEFTLSRGDLVAFDQRGLRLAGLRDARSLAAGSRIEAPTSILSVTTSGAFIDIGAFCNLSGGTINNVRFGRYCSVASGVVIGAHEHPTDWLTTSRTAYYPQVNGWDDLMAGQNVASIHDRTRPFTASCPTTNIGPDVWIGQGAFIKAGVTIGAGAIVGARALVHRDVPPPIPSSSASRAKLYACVSPTTRSNGCSLYNGGGIRSTIFSTRLSTTSSAPSM